MQVEVGKSRVSASVSSVELESQQAVLIEECYKELVSLAKEIGREWIIYYLALITEFQFHIHVKFVLLRYMHIPKCVYREITIL